MANSIRRRELITLAAGAASWPIAVRAQQRAVPVIGILGASTEARSGPLTVVDNAFLQGLREEGYVAERNVEILYHWAETQYDRLPALAADLVRRRVAVIFANPVAAALAAKAATTTIPIIFSVGGDPIEFGLVESLNRPGGNVTGTTFLQQELVAKRLELLHEIAPAATAVGYLVNSTNPQVEAEIRQAQAAVRILGVRLVILNASTPGEIEAAFASLVSQRIGAVLVDAEILFRIQRDQLVSLAAYHAVPAMYFTRDDVEAGGLISYGASLSGAWRLAGTYVGRILKGEKPADLPVQQSTRIETVLNLRTAKALGIEVPTATLLRATEVIE